MGAKKKTKEGRKEGGIFLLLEEENGGGEGGPTKQKKRSQQQQDFEEGLGQWGGGEGKRICERDEERRRVRERLVCQKQ